MITTLVFQPLVPFWAIAALGAIAGGLVLWAGWCGLSGWFLRLLAMVPILIALCGPAVQQQHGTPLSDKVLLVVDTTASQTLGDRAQMTEAAAQRLTLQLEARANTSVHRIDVEDSAQNSGTRLMSALADALAQHAQDRIAGILVLSDGQVHDMVQLPPLPAPLHFLHTGRPTDRDRRLTVKHAPAFAIVGAQVLLTLRVDELYGAAESVEAAPKTRIPLEIALADGTTQMLRIPTGEDVQVPLTLPHPGRNLFQLHLPPQAGELTTRNNSALVHINGVQDRLRILLVSGAPHLGGRTWRNLLKSDASVDLVHFTILRPPEKNDGVPSEELSLISFPTRELFLEKIEEFDLVIFDRYKRRGFLPPEYLDNIARYIENGGAVLIAAGPDFASANSLYRSPLARVIPARPTGRVREEPFLPQVSDLGTRHPITAGLLAGRTSEAAPWGRWLRWIDVVPRGGQVLMNAGAQQQAPLLVVERIGKGRVALLASDHAWLWDRGYDGGGPQGELLRRLTHWTMGEPELEEERLWAEAEGGRIRVIRQTLAQTGEALEAVEVQTPSGEREEITLQQMAPGRFEATYNATEPGLYQLGQGAQKTAIGVGPRAPKEFEHTLASLDLLAPVAAQTQGGVYALAEGLPALRTLRANRPAAGRGWMGLRERNALQITAITHIPLLPAWLALVLAGACLIAGWLREGRR
ncbi:MAG: hypothetical protein GDA40_12370 [Rhodobacteraceae bacterium]|nr:hypothetical protein [Paracoccaceae bacterium]